MAQLQLSEYIDQTNYTYASLIDVLMDKDEEFHERCKGTEVSKISKCPLGEGKGHISSLFRIEIEFLDGGKSYSVVVKTTSNAIVARTKAMLTDNNVKERFEDETEKFFADFFKTECLFYQKIASNITVPVPKVFAVEYPTDANIGGIIIMECLANRGVIESYKPFNVQKIINIVKEFVKLAAYSLKIGKDEIKKYEPVASPTSDVFIKTSAEKFVKLMPSYLTNTIDYLVKIVVGKDCFDYATNGINSVLGLPAVLCHSDVWANNIMWTSDEDGMPTDRLCALIDWQVLCSGSIGHDLSMLISLTVDPDLRHEIETWIFEFFHAVFVNELNKYGLKSPFSINDIRETYLRCMPRHILFFMYPCAALIEKRRLSSDPDVEEDCTGLLKRVKVGAEDCIRIIETRIPEWLNEKPNIS